MSSIALESSAGALRQRVTTRADDDGDPYSAVARADDVGTPGRLGVDEMPPGRRPVDTRVAARECERAYAFVRAQVQKGRQTFIIYPLVESSDKIEAKAL